MSKPTLTQEHRAKLSRSTQRWHWRVSSVREGVARLWVKHRDGRHVTVWVDEEFLPQLEGKNLCPRWLRDGHTKSPRIYPVIIVRDGALPTEGRPPGQMLHRLVCGLRGIKIDRAEVDHADGDARNCVRKNLRQATRSQNMQHRVTLPRANKSGVLGVFQDRKKSGWHAVLKIGGKFMLRETFPTLRQATAARRAAERKFQGEWAPTIRRKR